MNKARTYGERASGRARRQLTEGKARLARGPSRYGSLGLVARGVMGRATRHLETRQRLLDESIVEALGALAFETAIAHPGAGSFPERLDPTEVRLVETMVGPMFLHAHDHVMTPYIEQQLEWEPDEMAFLRAELRPGQTLLDIGANIGWFSVFGASLVGPEGRVIAVEPERRNLEVLKANLWQNGCSNVSLLPVAAGARRGFIGLQRNEANRGDHQVGLHEEVHDLVPLARLDELLAGVRLDVVKVDTQGFDHEAIAGLAECLKESAPTIMCEFWPPGLERRGVDAHRVAEGYRAMGFAIGILDDHGGISPTDPVALVEAALAHPTGYRNIVLRSAV